AWRRSPDPLISTPVVRGPAAVWRAWAHLTDGVAIVSGRRPVPRFADELRCNRIHPRKLAGVSMAQPDTATEQHAAEAVVRHHAQLAEALDGHAARLLDAAERADAPQVWQRRAEFVTWLHAELLPHARAEEATLYPAAAARPGGELLMA